MYNESKNPLLRPSAIFLIALSLSIGWGIRGNFGHEAGAMIAGVLSSIAVAVLSRREDWRRRVAYFALFGGLGWGFGGSISYMYPISFIESGQTASTWYGYFALFLEGGLWCGMGAAGLALAATMPRERLTRMFVPLCFVLALMGLRHFIEEPLEQWLVPSGGDAGDDTWSRHESPLYWYDADWFPAFMALIGVCLYELYDRFNRVRTQLIEHPAFVFLFMGVGAFVGYLAQRMLRAVDLEKPLGELLTVKLGDLDYVNPETGQSYAPEQLLNNWPQFFSDYPQNLGWGFGLLLGAAAFFLLTGKFRNDSKLFLYLSLGWLTAFIAMPVLGSIFLMEYGGFRVMPPRSDDWAGILGVFVAGLIWAYRHNLKPVSLVMSRAFILGGIAFASVPMIRYFLRFPGHPWRHSDGVPEFWQHYQSANWHGVLEQMHGFGHGIAIAIAMAMLWKSLPQHKNEPQTGMWTEVFAVPFVLFGVGYFNLHKLVGTWVGNGSVPASLKAPFFTFIEFEALTWFRIVWWSAAAVCTVLLILHARRRFEVMPPTWLGKGQLLYVLFLWLLVIGNLLRAIPGFSDGRMVTEWMLFMNACLTTLLVVILPRTGFHDSIWSKLPPWPSLGKMWRRGFITVVILMTEYAILTLGMYQEHLKDKPYANHTRFGPDAKWRVEPILKHGDHP